MDQEMIMTVYSKMPATLTAELTLIYTVHQAAMYLSLQYGHHVLYSSQNTRRACKGSVLSDQQ